jgi:ParB family transcriptional regulator, chromosome partitioning protein
MSRKSGLGKGLDALIPPSEFKREDEGISDRSGIREVLVENISPNPRQPRVRLDPEDLAELSASIKENGIIQPLIVTQNLPDGSYTLIAGERRLRAAHQAGLRTVPVIVREASEQQQLELALVENIQRADLTPLEAADAYRQLVEDFGLTHEQVADRVGKNRVSVTNTLRLLKLPEPVKQTLAEGKISEGHARALLTLQTEQAQKAALDTILKRELNVRQTEELVRKLTGLKPVPAPKRSPSPEIVALEERLRIYFGTRVTVKPHHTGGLVVIHYYSDEELNALIDRLLGES